MKTLTQNEMKAESINLVVTVKDTLVAIDGLAVKTTGQDKVVSSLYKNHGSTGLSVVCMAATELLETTAVEPDRAGNEGKQHAVIKTLRTSLKRATIESPRADGTQAYKTFEFDKDNVAVIVDKVTRPKITKDDTKVGEEGEEGEANASNMSKSLRAVWAGFIRVADDKVIKSMIRYFVKVAGYAPVKLTKV